MQIVLAFISPYCRRVVIYPECGLSLHLDYYKRVEDCGDADGNNGKSKIELTLFAKNKRKRKGKKDWKRILFRYSNFFNKIDKTKDGCGNTEND